MYDVIVVGAGVSGLHAAWQLQQEGLAVKVLEARSRTGGRTWSPMLAGVHVDLGASWIWEHEHHVLGLLEQLEVTTFASPPDGIDLLDRGGRVMPIRQATSWSPERRMVGGAEALSRALASRVHDVQLSTMVIRIRSTQATLIVETAKGQELECRAVVMALPPALMAETIACDEIAPELFERFGDVPTWMEQFAKVVAVFKTPFWAQQGLSGRAFSERGPMREIHDISGPDAQGKGVLFGFVPGPLRSSEGLLEKACQQFTHIFGARAKDEFEQGMVHVWWEDRATVTPRKRAPVQDLFGHAFLRQPLCEGRLFLTSTETAAVHAGHIEGAVHRSGAVARQIVQCFS